MTNKAEWKRLNDYNLVAMLKELARWLSEEAKDAIILDILVVFDADYSEWAATIYYSGDIHDK